VSFVRKGLAIHMLSRLHASSGAPVMLHELTRVDQVRRLCKRSVQGIRVPGIGHRIKSKDNRDARVMLLQDYARQVTRPTLSGVCQSLGVDLQSGLDPTTTSGVPSSLA
jgi:hypothetical protein